MTDKSSEELTDIELKTIIQLVHKHTGMTMTTNKKSLLQGRLRPRMRTLGLTTFAEYIRYLSDHRDETQDFINRITTNETSFFRTSRVWDYFQNEFLPKWQKENKGKKLRIWSGASSTGEEIYTIGICCHEFTLKFADFDYSILGTDISTNVLNQAKKGLYNGKSIDNLKNSNQKVFEKYFKQNDGAFTVSETVRSKIQFAPHNLLFPQPSTFDLVFLRNVLIYFEGAEQEKILSNVSQSLVDRGQLILGESESLTGIKTNFQFIAPLVYENRKT
jgi:chemotaxis protein methyltransferase CheR